MRKKEQRLWDTMKRQLKSFGFWLQRVENVAGTGMPDVYVARHRVPGDWRGRTAWVELKAPTRPKRLTTPLLGSEGLNPDQVNWHINARTHGIDSYILVRCSEGKLYMVEGDYAETINEKSLEDFEEFEATWQDVARILI